ncbi:MerC domain-containing protein [Zobellia laminariae]|uniref:MerC domain-containing protein n=1 Tax=Zobellia laminariae TaxID=248906 RepID=UPI0012D86BD7|nr:MerC domain-containing protein [Zobellia laminariae]
MKIKKNTIDLIALSSALICAIHCMAIPMLLSISALNSLYFLENPYVEGIFISLGIVFVFTSLWPSYKKIHFQAKPLLYAALGFIFIALGRLNLTELWEITNTVTGSVLISLGHFLNWKLLRTIENYV